MVSLCEAALRENRLRKGVNGGIYFMKRDRRTGIMHKHYCSAAFIKCARKDMTRLREIQRRLPTTPNARVRRRRRN